MGQIEEHLKRWLDAGVVEAATAERIRAYEQGQSAGRPSTDERPGALEALLYLGLVVLAVGVFALFAQQWGELESWARVSAIAVPLVLLLIAGTAMRQSKDPEMMRGSEAAWFVSVALFAGLLGVFFNEYDFGFSEQDERGPLLVVAAATFLLSLGLWVLSPKDAQLLAFAGSGVFLGQAIGAWPDQFSNELAGMTILGIGAAGIVLAEAGWFTPVNTARLLFSALCIIGPYEAGAGDGSLGFELLAGAIAAAVIAYGVARGSFLMVLVGVAGAFLFLVSFIFEHFEDRLGAPLALMICGGVMIAAVLVLTAFRSEIQARRQRA